MDATQAEERLKVSCVSTLQDERTEVKSWFRAHWQQTRTRYCFLNSRSITTTRQKCTEKAAQSFVMYVPRAQSTLEKIVS